jgi:hypothetical protein
MLSHRMEKGIALDLGGATAEMVDVVALESDKITGAIEVDDPVVISITCRAIVADSVKIGI